MLCALPIEGVLPREEASQALPIALANGGAGPEPAPGQAHSGNSRPPDGHAGTDAASRPLDFTEISSELDAAFEDLLRETLRLKDFALEVSSKLDQTQTNLYNILSRRPGDAAEVEAVLLVEQNVLLEQLERLDNLSWMAMEHRLRQARAVLEKMDAMLNCGTADAPHGLQNAKVAIQELVQRNALLVQWQSASNLFGRCVNVSLVEIWRVLASRTHAARFERVRRTTEQHLDSVSSVVSEIVEGAELTLVRLSSW